MFSKEKITSFKKITLKLSSMRVAEEYEILCGNSSAELSLYTVLYSNGEDNRRLEKRVEAGSAEILKILNECNVINWDGFEGKNPPHILDGTMFTFEAEVNDGKKIYASGSNKFPKHYREFLNLLNELLKSGG